MVPQCNGKCYNIKLLNGVGGHQKHYFDFSTTSPKGFLRELDYNTNMN